MKRDYQEVVRKLEGVLRREIHLHERYLTLLEQEQKAVVGFQHEKIGAAVAEREHLLARMQEEQRERRELLLFFPESDGKKASSLVKLHCRPRDVRKLLPLVDHLRSLVLAEQRAGREFNQVVQFSMNMINASISMIWSATQNVVEAYSPKGTRREYSHPGNSRLAGVLTQA